MTEDRAAKNPSRKDRSRTSPANEYQVWNGDVDDETDAGRDRPDSRDQADEEDEK